MKSYVFMHTPHMRANIVYDAENDWKTLAGINNEVIHVVKMTMSYENMNVVALMNYACFPSRKYKSWFNTKSNFGRR